MIRYQTIRKEAESRFTEKKSVFIGRMAPVKTEEEAQAFIQRIRRQEYDATHNVPAYRLRESGICRCSDDGEPQGTAGIPALDVLTKQGLEDVVLVITRYYGGTMLGAGGLVRAYTNSAVLTAEAAERITYTECICYELKLDYSFYGTLQHFLEKRDHVVQSTDFSECVTMRLLIPAEEGEGFLKQVTELFSGQVSPKDLGREFAEIK